MYYRDPNSKLGYIPIHKNASTTYNQFFQKAGWERLDGKMPNNITYFSHIQNPWVRYCKGLAQLAWNEHERNFEFVLRNKFFKTALFNPHIMPISLMYPDMYNNIEFILLDGSENPNDLTNNWLHNHNIEISIDPAKRSNAASNKKQSYQKQVMKWVNDKHPYKQQIISLLETDLQLWRDASKPLPDIRKTWGQKLRNLIWTSE